MTPPARPAGEHRRDSVLGFALPGRNARGRVVLLDETLDAILKAHAYAPAVAALMGETLVLAVLIGALLQPDEGQVTLQARGKGGPVELLVADYRDGELRGYASQNLDRRFAVDAATEGTLRALLGEGYFAITIEDTKAAERYQGIVELKGETLQQAAEAYFTDSEQVPTLIRIATQRRPDGRLVAGGVLVQHVARAEEGGVRLHVADGDTDNWDHVAALVGTLGAAELADRALSHEALLWRLFHEEEVRVFPAQAITRGCRCTEAHIREVLGRFSEEERQDMRNSEGKIVVDCEFCARQFVMDL